MTDKEIQLFHKTQAVLESVSTVLIKDLNVVLNENFDLFESYSVKDIAFLDFEVTLEGCIRLYPSDKDWTQLGYKILLKEFPSGLIVDHQVELNLDEYDFDNDEDMDRMDAYHEKVEAVIFEWFSKCWDKAGGLESKYKFYLGTHDAYQVFDLKHKIWISDNEK